MDGYQDFATAAELRAHYVERGITSKPKPAVAVRAKPTPPTIPVKVETPVVRDWIFLSEANLRIPTTLIREAVCVTMCIRQADLLSSRRQRNLVTARKVFCWLCHKHSQLSYPAIGRMLGGKDHTTILHHIKDLDTNPQAYREQIARVQGYLQSKGFGV